jgi:ribonuclease R
MLTTKPLPQRLLDTLPKSRGDGMTGAALASELNLNESQRAMLDEYLAHFVRTGLAESKGNRFWRKRRSGLLIGTLRGTRSGHAFVIPDDERERRAGDLYIPERHLGSALHGDKVVASIRGSDRRGREGRIEAVMHHANTTVVGRFIKLRQQGLISPIDERLMHEIAIAPSDSMGASDGDVVNAEITRPPAGGRPPWGRVIEVLGREDTPGIDLEMVIRKHRLRFVFPDDVLEEADAIPDSISESELSDRVDLREQLTITIDGETARDFDDAVSLEVLPSGRWLLGVHIADVSHYVREGSPLDEEAYRRGTSVYFPERAIPMLPERLSNDICSLNPKTDRLTMSALIELDRKGRVVDYRLTPSIIHSRERMTYTDVDKIIADPSGETARRYDHIRNFVLSMHELTLILIERRQERGAIDFELPETELRFNDEGRIAGVLRSERNIAHRLIEEFMLLANETVAKHLESLRVPSLYRIHEAPNPDKVEVFAEIAESFGHKFSTHGPLPQRGFQHLMREIHGLPEERMLSYLMLRSMQRARYSAQNEGHFGLAMKSYTHFTSPIRRYPDLIVHRTLREVIERGHGEDGWSNIDLGSKRALKAISSPVFDEERERALRQLLVSIADESSERERVADNAERELIDWRKAEFMANHVGDEFDGVITSVAEHGVYVELDEHFVEGLVHRSTLTDDVYQYQERKHRLIGERRGRAFRLGDPVRVLVDRVDRTRHFIDFSLVSKR